ncbi:hypothetical protein KAFR_0G02370 [Kazachstania africana CBS 2517]|uniref:Meiotically up-regulated protein Msb1/Mug8 domain-containing protein n=1 Tax=Kazachstania africana (strain ATCC 22294 / BCRC 22015 / CBS 2517 / CECT 1963 / NBRC 1671 / NRRL Y-8276) TaxID=1071382 RepID=H2AY21_KAZAF|nr:hypothetical protein KAFR_0G02370 [Kazachstania africana CBS 2517]CCF59271.1 hypothetical protein KAFR_0G02370 [Kazachstania africana CBS 2517]
MNETIKPLPNPPVNKSRPTSPVRKADKAQQDGDDEEFEFFNDFERDKVKGVIHLITASLKEKAIDVEYLMIPFRPEQTNEKLLRFLNEIFPQGNGVPVNDSLQAKIISKTNEWTLFQSLKYIWARLPNSEVIGWQAYLEFKLREAEKNFPQKAFLEIMPQCLDSPHHASIVYDFFDLIVTIASNAKVNKLSARKISKMCAIWAFDKPVHVNKGNDLDFDSKTPINPEKKSNNSLQDGLDQWIPGSDAMFHLLLAFLKSFITNDLETSKLPRSLKSVLFNNDYPPEGSTAYSSETILTIPLVTLYTDDFSRKPWQLLERCNDLLDFSNHDAFEAREDYALLKSLFKKKNNVEGISRKMSQESRRIMKLMSTKHSTLQAGWARRRPLENIHELDEFIQVKRVDIDDYFIWTWLSSLSYEQTSQKKKIFGRSLILEFEFDGFKKWVVFQECDITLAYNSQSQLKKQIESNKREEVSTTEPEEQHGAQEGSPSYLIGKSPTAVSPIQIEQQSNPGAYHTVISKDVLNKNSAKHNKNLHVFEQKLYKWNPLNNLRKKSSSSNSSSIHETALPNEVQTTAEVDYNYELPPVDTGKNFQVDIANVKELPSQFSKRDKSTKDNNNNNNNTIAEINGMVEQMMIKDYENERTPVIEQETFESVTRFDHYKSSNLSHMEFDAASSISSPIESLKINNRTEESISEPKAYAKPLPLVDTKRKNSPTQPSSLQYAISSSSRTPSPQRPRVQPQLQPQPQLQIQPQPQPQSQPQLQPQLQTQPQPQPQPQLQPQLQPQPQIQTQTQLQPQVQIPPQAQPRSQIQFQQQGSSKTTTIPQAQPQASSIQFQQYEGTNSEIQYIQPQCLSEQKASTTSDLSIKEEFSSDSFNPNRRTNPQHSPMRNIQKNGLSPSPVLERQDVSPRHQQPIMQSPSSQPILKSPSPPLNQLPPAQLTNGYAQSPVASSQDMYFSPSNLQSVLPVTNISPQARQEKFLPVMQAQAYPYNNLTPIVRQQKQGTNVASQNQYAQVQPSYLTKRQQHASPQAYNQGRHQQPYMMNPQSYNQGYYNNYPQGQPMQPAQLVQPLPPSQPIQQAQNYAGYVHSTPPPVNIPVASFSANRLHGNTNKRQDRKKLYDNIRSGNFGI